MNFSLPSEIEEMREATRELVASLLAHEARYERTKVVPDEVTQSLRRMGYYGMRIPEAYGGTSLGMLATVVVVTELSRLPPQWWPFLRVVLGPTSHALVKYGSETQRRRWLPAMARGECGVAFVLTEAGAGSDLSSMRTRAERTGSRYVLNGAKMYISNADAADLFVVFARQDNRQGLRGALSAFLIERGHPGMLIGKAMPTMGTTLNGLFEVQFIDCDVPADSLLGEEGCGFQYAMGSLNEGRLNVGATAVGMGEYALELVVDHVKGRIAHGLPLAELQAVQHMLANAATDMHAARLMLLEAAWQFDQGRLDSVKSSMVKVFNTEAAGRAVDTAVQLFGAAGYSRGMAVERLYRDVRALRIYEGASEILRNVIGRSLVK